jgi:AcrR family transcriptional regulator
MPTGLRERKKERTRATIARAALELFARHGFTATTVTDIANAAEVAPRTVSTYFPSKEGIVFAEYRDAIDRLRGQLERRQPGETLGDALRAWLTAEETTQVEPARVLVGASNGTGVDFARLRERAIERDQDLWGMREREMREVRELVGAAWAADLGVAHDSLEARTIGAATAATLVELNAFAARRGGAATDSLNTILDFLQAGVAALNK